MRRVCLLFGVTIVTGLSAFGCGGHTVSITGSPDAGQIGDNPIGPDGGPIGPTDLDAGAGVGVRVASKVDLLFMIDNSASMGTKQDLLRQAVPDLLHRLVAPNCVDGSGTTIGASAGGKCATGTLEFAPVADIHVGIVSSSLGGRGSEQCNPDATNPVMQTLNRHNDDKGHLINRVGADEHAEPAAGASNFLAWTPSSGSGDTLSQSFQDMASGVHEYGCGLEAQMESWYRFLVQPDPYEQIIADPSNPNHRVLDGVDGVLLQQRHDFLRPDSLVGVILLTDEDDSTVDPLSADGHGWAFESSKFPGSCGGGAARGTAACDHVATVATAACASCGLLGHESDPGCLKTGDACGGTGQPQPGYYTAQQDTLNVRMFHMKQRFGLDPQFPIARYVDGLTSRTVPDREHEHAAGGDGTYTGEKSCTNPLFAQSLPTDPSADLCHLPQGTRGSDLVFYAIIGGVPHQLLQADPSNANSPLKKTLTADDWKKIVGNNPSAYDYTGVDPHMWQAIAPNDGPRAHLPLPTAGDTADPASGREWDSQGNDLQYACTFALPTPVDCSDPVNAVACDCNPGSTAPLCDPTTKTMQIRGKAYPTLRELDVARQLQAQGIAASICPIHTQEAAPGDPLFGFRPVMQAIGDRFAPSLVKSLAKAP